MTARRGWCPSLFDPMPSGDGLLVRVKHPRGMLSAAAALVLAEAASRHGNGTIELTSRGNLQIRGLAPASVAPFAATMIGCGLANANPEAERRRVVMCSPLVGDDPSLAADVSVVADEIERGLIEQAHFGALPPKFGIVVDGGGVLPLLGVRGDIAVRAAGLGFALSIDGDGLAAHCAAEETAPGVLRLVRAFIELSRRLSVVPGRMRELVLAVSSASVFSAAGLRQAPLHRGSVENPIAEALPNPIGYRRYPEVGFGAFGLGVPFGHMTSAMLTGLAEFAMRFGDGMLRLTPWRAVLIGGVAEADAPRLLAAAANAGLIVDAEDRRRSIVACPGQPSCSSASVTTRADAALLAAAGAVLPSVVHISGCSKGCAHSSAADITLVGDNGRYGLVRNGTAGMALQIAGLTIAEAIGLLNREMAA